MSDWISETVGNVVEYTKGFAFKSFDYKTKGVPIVKVKNFTTDSIDLSDCDFLSEEEKNKYIKYSIKENDVIIATVGSWLTNPNSVVGKTVRVPSKAKGGLLNQNAVRLRAKNNFDQRFLFYLLRHDKFKYYIVGTAQGSANQASITLNDIFNYNFEIPPLQEQKAIAHILGSLDDKIELNRQMNQTLEAMAQALFKSWFVDFDPVMDNALASGQEIPDELLAMAEKRSLVSKNQKLLFKNPELAALFPSSFGYNETLAKWIPEGWEVKSVEDAFHVNPSVSIKKGEIKKFVDMKALPTSGYSIDGFAEKEYNGGAKFKQGDVLLARITPCLENGKTAIVDFLNNEEAGFGSTEFIIIRGKADIKTPFVACLSRYEAFVNHCIQNMVGSSGRQRVQNSCFNSYFLALPKNEILKKFDRVTNPIFLKITKNSNEADTLTQLRDKLLPELISGKVRVNEGMN